MNSLIDWLNKKPVTSRRNTLIGIAVLSLLLVAVTGIALPPAAPLVGAIAGVGLFVSVYGWWATTLDPTQQDRTDLKARVPLGKRRGLVGAMLAVWVIFLLLLGPHLPAPALGTGNVFIAISLYWLWRATPVEAAEQRAAWEAAQAEAEAQAEAQSETGAEENR